MPWPNKIIKLVSSELSCKYNKITNCTKQLVKIVLSDTPTRSLSFFLQCDTSLENAKNSNTVWSKVTIAVVMSNQGFVSRSVRLISSNSTPPPPWAAACSKDMVMEA